MPHAGDEIAESERPLADVLEPVLERVHTLFHSALQKMIPGVTPDHVARGDAEDVARTCANQSRDQTQLASPDEIYQMPANRFVYTVAQGFRTPGTMRYTTFWLFQRNCRTV